MFYYVKSIKVYFYKRSLHRLMNFQFQTNDYNAPS